MRRVLVTGAGGYVGRAFAEAHGARYRLRLFAKRPLPGPHETVIGDVRDPASLARALEGVDAVLHLAAVTTDTPGATEADYFMTNTVGTFNVLDAAVRAGVRRVVYASSVCAVGFRATPTVVREEDPCRPSDGMYGYSKYLGERLCECFAEQHGLAAVSLRVAMVVPQHELHVPADPSAPAWLGAVHVEDVVEALRLALDSDSVRAGTFHVASPSPSSKFDISRARAVLGYAPRHALDDGLPPLALRLAKGALRRLKRGLGL